MVSAKNAQINEVDTIQCPAQDTQPIFLGPERDRSRTQLDTSHSVRNKATAGSFCPSWLGWLGLLQCHGGGRIGMRGPWFGYCGEEPLP